MSQLSVLSKQTLVSSTAEIGFLLSIFSFGVFMRIFNSLLQLNHFIIPYVGLLIGAVLIGIAIMPFLPFNSPHAKEMVWAITLGIASYSYWFLWQMPEVDENLGNYKFASWNPFAVGGTAAFLDIFLVLNVGNLIW